MMERFRLLCDGATHRVIGEGIRFSDDTCVVRWLGRGSTQSWPTRQTMATDVGQHIATLGAACVVDWLDPVTESEGVTW